MFLDAHFNVEIFKKKAVTLARKFISTLKYDYVIMFASCLVFHRLFNCVSLDLAVPLDLGLSHGCYRLHIDLRSTCIR